MILGIGNTVNASPNFGNAGPSDCPGLLLWYKYKTGYYSVAGDLWDIDNDPPNDATNLGKWADSKGTNHAEQGTGVDRTKYDSSDKSVEFLNNIKYMSLTTDITVAEGDDFTLAVCAKQSPSGAWSEDTFIGGDNDVIKIYDPTNIKIKYGGSTNTVTGADLSEKVYHSFIFIRKDNVTKIYVDGVEWGTSGNDFTDNGEFDFSTLGSMETEGDNWKGNMKDVSFYTVALGYHHVQLLHHYLVNLPLNTFYGKLSH
jgi:hypothetical protein